MVSTRSGRVDLYWIPLGAGGTGFVRFNGRVYETIRARRERRRPQALYHSALEVQVPDGRFTVENAWPVPDDDGASRGVVVEGPVGSPRLARTRAFRYEVRCWRDGTIPDLDAAVGGPRRLSDDPDRARRLLDLVAEVPPMIWGRDQLGVGDMWNSNSTISWLLAAAGLGPAALGPPPGGRAPGWRAGILAAHRGSEGLHPAH